MSGSVAVARQFFLNTTKLYQIIQTCTYIIFYLSLFYSSVTAMDQDLLSSSYADNELSLNLWRPETTR